MLNPVTIAINAPSNGSGRLSTTTAAVNKTMSPKKMINGEMKNRMHDQNCPNADEEEEEDDTTSITTCPLFMEGLPTDFESNPQLAAIASLLGDEDEEKSPPRKLPSHTRTMPMGKPGGGKIRGSSRTQRRHQPYNSDSTAASKKKTTASMGEAQLFLKMWKI